MADRRQRLGFAQSLLACGDERSLWYAALELRQLIEVVVYQKLASYAEYVPESVTRTWQPPQAIKALLQFEPDADKDFSLRIAAESSAGDEDRSWVNLGHHKALGAKWLSKSYNKLGSYLHAPHGTQVGPEPAKMRAALEGILEELDAVVVAPIIAMSMDERITVQCVACGQPLCANVDALRELGVAVCFNPDCGAVHIAEEADGEWTFRLDQINAPCESCGEEVWFSKSFLLPGAVVECPSCNGKHEMRLGWVLLDDADDGAN